MRNNPPHSEPDPRQFRCSGDVFALTEGLIHGTLPVTSWTHEAHLAVCLCLLRHYPHIRVSEAMPALIMRFNEAAGVENSDRSGFHATITQFYVQAIAAYVAHHEKGQPLVELANRLLLLPLGRRDVPLRFYSRQLLFSVEARRQFVEPDLCPLDFSNVLRLDLLPEESERSLAD